MKLPHIKITERTQSHGYYSTKQTIFAHEITTKNKFSKVVQRKQGY